MNKNIKTLIIIIIAIAIIVPVGIVAYKSYNNSQDTPVNFIPSNTTFLLKINYNGSNYYTFGSQSGIALMIPVSKSFSVSNQNLTFNATRIPISVYGNYGGFTIYNISLYNIIYDSILNITANHSIPYVPINSYLGNFTSFSLYLYEPFSNEIIIGNLQEVKFSINAYDHGTNFVSKSKYINNKGIVDFYLHYNSTTAWGNYSSNFTYIFLNGNKSFISGIYNESGYLSLIGYKVKLINSTTLELIMPMKLDNRNR